MKIETNHNSPLVMEKILITEGTFKCTQENIDELTLGVKVDRNIEKTSDEGYKVELSVTVADKAENIKVFASATGIFNTSQNYIELVERNAIAIMFPYLRSYISLLTTQPGMNPIVLPAINIMSLLKD